MNQPMHNEQGWEEKFYELTKTMDGQDRPKLKLLIASLHQSQIEEIKKLGKKYSGIAMYDEAIADVLAILKK